MKNYRVTIDGRVYDVEIDDPQARPVTARLSGTAYSVEIESGQALPAESEAKMVPPTPPEHTASPNESKTANPRREPDPPSNVSTPDSGQTTPQGMTAPIPPRRMYQKGRCISTFMRPRGVAPRRAQLAG